MRVVRGAADFGRVQPGDVVCDGGGPLSHTAIVAREHGLPTVMGAGDATTRLYDGQRVTVVGSTGTVQVQPD